MPTGNNEKEQQVKLIQLIQEAVERDAALREKYQIGDKFRFVREKLLNLLTQQEYAFQESLPEEKQKSSALGSGEVAVYVYLYNANGLLLRNWQNMLTPTVFYEYSVNRPIYTDKAYVESLLRAKKNKFQHAYLTIAVKPEDILQSSSGTILKDSSGNPVVKVKEGSLHFDKLIGFTHNEQNYTLGANGEFVKES